MKIKLCGMFRDCDIDYVNEAKPDYIGFIVLFSKSHRNISLDTALRLKERLLPDIKSVAVSVDAPAEEFAQFALSGAADILQLHGNEDADYIAKLRGLVDCLLFKAVKVTDFSDIERAQALDVDYLVLDNGTGTGRQFDHSVIAEKRITKPFFLAGGITPENIPDAARFHPFGVDLSSGIETERVKDRGKIIKAVSAARMCSS